MWAAGECNPHNPYRLPVALVLPVVLAAPSEEKDERYVWQSGSEAANHTYFDWLAKTWFQQKPVS